MRCRKVRSFLSAYCSGELDRRHNRAVSEHLLTCAACRREEAVYRQMAEAVAEVPQMGITEDFNSRLLNRIAQERFAETRTKAYMPKPAPLFLWRRVAPVLATFCLAVFVVFSGLGPILDRGPDNVSDEGNLDNSYLTAQPDSNPNMTVHMTRDWSLNGQLARAERVSRISNQVAPASSYAGWSDARSLTTMVSSGYRSAPYSTSLSRMRPVQRYYSAPSSTSGTEGQKAY